MTGGQLGDGDTQPRLLASQTRRHVGTFTGYIRLKSRLTPLRVMRVVELAGKDVTCWGTEAPLSPSTGPEISWMQTPQTHMSGTKIHGDKRN